MKPRPSLPDRSVGGSRQGPSPAFNPNRPFAGPASRESRAPIIREIGAAADYLRDVGRELAALGANELSKDRIPVASRELDDIVEDGIEFSCAVMTAVEDVADAADLDDTAFRALVAQRLTAITEQCAYQDIIAQRARRVRAILDEMERRLSRLATFAATRDTPDLADFGNGPEASPSAKAGPPPRGKGNAQVEIDRILSDDEQRQERPVQQDDERRRAASRAVTRRGRT